MKLEAKARLQLTAEPASNDADNAGGTGFEPTETNQDLVNKLDDSLIGAGYRLLDLHPAGLFPKGKK